MTEFKPIWVFVDEFWVDRGSCYAKEVPFVDCEGYGGWVGITGINPEYDEDATPALKYVGHYSRRLHMGMILGQPVLVEEAHVDWEISDKYGDQIGAQWLKLKEKFVTADRALVKLHKIGRNESRFNNGKGVV